MKKRLLSGVLIIALLWGAPFSRMDLTSDAFTGTAETNTPSDAVPETKDVPVFTDGVYTLSIPSSVGLLTYYSQHDSRWADALYGGQDPITSYGCGPTVLAMLVSSFTGQTTFPSEMADWAAANNYWAAGSGTKHDFIMEGAAAFGFHAESFQNYTKEGIISELKNGHILVALMGPGHFTVSGHFIILSDYWSGDKISVADPASLENTQTPWDAQIVLDELLYGSKGGGPLWSITPK